jgi:nitrite reductase/ring-hydroxylating ferredoxin subunit
MNADRPATDLPETSIIEAPLEGEVRRVLHRETYVLLARVNGTTYAVADSCTHGKASLSQGYLDGWEIECPLHQGRFDIRTGKATASPCRQPLAVFKVREHDGNVQILDSTSNDD